MDNKYSETESKYIQAVMKKTGWSFDEATKKMETDRKNTASLLMIISSIPSGRCRLM